LDDIDSTNALIPYLHHRITSGPYRLDDAFDVSVAYASHYNSKA